MLDFFERQEAARKQTRRLILYFILAVAGIVLSLYLVAALFFLGPDESGPLINQAVDAQLLPRSGWWNAELFLIVTLFAALTITLGSSIKTFQLAKGGRAVAEMLGGKLISTQTADPEERRLLNIVEEMSIASGTPMPAIYVLENEPGINAFAAGHDTSDAAIGVTRGCIHLLNRDELQGVIAHEFSHILNGDMALNMRLTCLTHGILFIALAGYMLLRLPGRLIFLPSRSDRKQSSLHPGIILAILLLGVCLVIVGSIGVFFANLIKSAISRQREFLADAAAVQFTRNPLGIAGALKKIGGWTHGSRIQSPNAREASHFFFGDGVAASLFGWFATHPPLAERIRLLDPSFTGALEPVPDPPPPSPSGTSDPGSAAVSSNDPILVDALGLFSIKHNPERVQSTVTALAAAAAAAPPPLITHHSNVAAHLERLAQSISPQLSEAIHDPHGACAVVFLLLTADEPHTRPELFAHIDQDIFIGLHDEMERLAGDIATVPAGHRLSLIDLCIPALRSLAPGQYRAFRQTLQKLIEADGSISLFEYALDKVLLRHLDAHFNGHSPSPVRFNALAPVLGDVIVLLSTLAHLNQHGPDGPPQAYQAGIRQLNIEGVNAPILPPEACNLAAVDHALDTLKGLAPILKKNVLFAAGQVAMVNGRLAREESELIRAIADVLGCPLPPFLAEAPLDPPAT